jgi:hypothetical protein
LWAFPPVWPDWANFCHLGSRLLWAFFENYIHTIQYTYTKFWHTYSTEKVIFISTKMGSWARFWAIFQKSFGDPDFRQNSLESDVVVPQPLGRDLVLLANLNARLLQNLRKKAISWKTIFSILILSIFSVLPGVDVITILLEGVDAQLRDFMWPRDMFYTVWCKS